MTDAKKKPTDGSGETTIRSIRVSDKDWDDWDRRAKDLGLNVSVWLRMLARRDIKRGQRSKE
jgi:hypothetical protein